MQEHPAAAPPTSEQGRAPTPVDQMATCTVRIVASRGGVAVSVGTGFLYAIPGGGRNLLALITNKHVVEGCDSITTRFTAVPAAFPLDRMARPEEQSHHEFVANTPIRVDHPGPVDLCAFNFSEVANELERRGLRLHNAFLGPAAHVDSEIGSFLRAAEPIAMVGYPNGIWDSVNNAPVIRRGTTATHPLVRYEGRSEFLIDAACFPGSSGSPVFLFEDGWVRSGVNSYSPGTRIALLGVLYAGPHLSQEGVLEPRPIPHNFGVVPVTRVMLNLGFVIHAAEIHVLTQRLVELAGFPATSA